MAAIHVRAMRIQDLVRLRSVRTEAASLHYPIGAFSRRIIDPRAIIPFSRREHKSYVAQLDGRPVGLADFLADSANHRWILTRVALARHTEWLDDALRDQVWRELLVHAIRAAGASRANRIHASFPESAVIVPALQETGFTVYARESVLVVRQLPSSIAEEGVTRRQEPTDAWSVHQLYHAVTPRPIQYAEALTSNFWDTGVSSIVPTRGYVVEHGFEVAGYCRVVSSGNRHVLQPMVERNGLDLLEPLLRDVLSDLSPSSGESVIISVPDYLQEYLPTVESLGFEPLGRQLRMVKYTVVPRRMQLRSVERLAQELPERAVAGTPSFYTAGGHDSGAENGPDSPGTFPNLKGLR